MTPRFCCDGRCNERQGRGPGAGARCPHHRHASRAIAEAVLGALLFAFVLGVLGPYVDTAAERALASRPQQPLPALNASAP